MRSRRTLLLAVVAAVAVIAVAWFVVRYLARGHSTTTHFDPERYNSAYAALRGKQATELQEILSDDRRPSEQRWAAVDLIAASDLPKGEKTAVLVGLLDDRDVVLQRSAISNLGLHELSGSANELRELMWQDTPNQGEVLEALARFGDAGVLEPCRALLSDPSEDKRLDAISPLAILGSAEALAELEGVLQKDASRSVRLIAALALAGLGNHAGEPFLEQQLDSNDKWERAEVSVALARLGNVPGLLYLKQLVNRCPPSDEQIMRRKVLVPLRIEGLVERDDWKQVVVRWIDAQLARR